MRTPPGTPPKIPPEDDGKNEKSGFVSQDVSDNIGETAELARDLIEGNITESNGDIDDISADKIDDKKSEESESLSKEQFKKLLKKKNSSGNLSLREVVFNWDLLLEIFGNDIGRKLNNSFLSSFNDFCKGTSHSYNITSTHIYYLMKDYGDLIKSFINKDNYLELLYKILLVRDIVRNEKIKILKDSERIDFFSFIKEKFTNEEISNNILPYIVDLESKITIKLEEFEKDKFLDELKSKMGKNMVNNINQGGTPLATDDEKLKEQGNQIENSGYSEETREVVEDTLKGSQSVLDNLGNSTETPITEIVEIVFDEEYESIDENNKVLLVKQFKEGSLNFMDIIKNWKLLDIYKNTDNQKIFFGYIEKIDDLSNLDRNNILETIESYYKKIHRCCKYYPDNLFFLISDLTELEDKIKNLDPKLKKIFKFFIKEYVLYGYFEHYLNRLNINKINKLLKVVLSNEYFQKIDDSFKFDFIGFIWEKIKNDRHLDNEKINKLLEILLSNENFQKIDDSFRFDFISFIWLNIKNDKSFDQEKIYGLLEILLLNDFKNLDRYTKEIFGEFISKRMKKNTINIDKIKLLLEVFTCDNFKNLKDYQINFTYFAIGKIEYLNKAKINTFLEMLVNYYEEIKKLDYDLDILYEEFLKNSNIDQLLKELSLKNEYYFKLNDDLKIFFEKIIGEKVKNDISLNKENIHQLFKIIYDNQKDLREEIIKFLKKYVENNIESLDIEKIKLLISFNNKIELFAYTKEGVIEYLSTNIDKLFLLSSILQKYDDYFQNYRIVNKSIFITIIYEIIKNDVTIDEKSIDQIFKIKDKFTVRSTLGKKILIDYIFNEIKNNRSLDENKINKLLEIINNDEFVFECSYRFINYVNTLDFDTIYNYYSLLLKHSKNFNKLGKYESKIFFENFLLNIIKNNKSIDDKQIDELLEQIIEFHNKVNNISLQYIFSQLILDKFEKNEPITNERIDELLKLYNDNSINKFPFGLKKVFINYVDKKLDKNESFDVVKLKEIFSRLYYSNSIELSGLSDRFADQLLDSEDPEGNLKELEKIFLRNNLPLFGKMFLTFKILYSDLAKFDFTDGSRIAPQLKDETLPDIGENLDNNQKRHQIIFNDLLRIAYKSNERSFMEYLDNIEEGSKIFLDLKDKNYDLDGLEKEKLEILKIFISHLDALYYSSNGKQELDKDLKYKLKLYHRFLKIYKEEDLKDKIIESFCGMAGIKSFDELKKLASDAKIEQKERIDGLIEKYNLNGDGIFKLENGDFIRCPGTYEMLGSSLNGGNVSKEHLGSITGTSGSDTTPLDVDLTRIEWSPKNIREAIVEKLPDGNNNPTGTGFGNIYVVFKKDNPNLNITRNSYGITGNNYDPLKLETFGTNIDGTKAPVHRGIRTGFAFTDIDCIIYNPDGKEDNYDDLPAIKFEIARNGYYIPMVDFSGKLIFTQEEFEQIRKKMQGLNHYGEESFEFSENLISLTKVSTKEGIKETDKKRQKIVDKVKNVIEEFYKENSLGSVEMKSEIGEDLTNGTVEFIDVGSTGRGTNVPGDGDFDFFMRLDAEIIRNSELMNKLREKIRSSLKFEKEIPSDKGLRLKNVEIDKETILDIDISFGVKTSKVAYSSDECLRDRLATIKRLDPNKYNLVIANIIQAKQFLKKIGVYKPRRSFREEGERLNGGLGGVGVENWILQNGGSFKDATREFVEAAKKVINFPSDYTIEQFEVDFKSNSTHYFKIFDEFKSIYQIWDFGENHFKGEEKGYLHDNFIVTNLGIKGFIKMFIALKDYLDEIGKK